LTELSRFLRRPAPRHDKPRGKNGQSKQPPACSESEPALAAVLSAGAGVVMIEATVDASADMPCPSSPSAVTAPE
jgi:hypothetical protein